MREYNYSDIILDPRDPRLKIGARCFTGTYPTQTLLKANSGAGPDTLVGISYRYFTHFITEGPSGTRRESTYVILV